MNHEELMRRAIALAQEARNAGNHPFGALIADANGNILVEAQNTVVTQKDCTGHAETNLMRAASKQFEANSLQDCTLYTSTEPCAMCAGAMYWGGIGHVIYGLREKELLNLTGSHNENPTLDLPCEDVFAKGQRKIKVTGPFLEDEAKKVHEGFWS